MKAVIKRLNFTLSESLYEKLRKEAFIRKTVKGKIIRVALEQYFDRDKKLS